MSAIATTRTRIVKVVGVTFTRGYPSNILLLRDIAEAAEATGERLTVVLVRNPDNPHDANAVEIHVPALGDMAMIGHVPRDAAARLAARMDAGDRFKAEVAWTRNDPAHTDRPGIDIAIARVLEPNTRTAPAA
jgi:hypothetical protein